MNDDIARALVELVDTLQLAVDAISSDPNRSAANLTLFIGAVETAVDNYNNNTYYVLDACGNPVFSL